MRTQDDVSETRDARTPIVDLIDNMNADGHVLIFTASANTFRATELKVRLMLLGNQGFEPDANYRHGGGRDSNELQ